MTATANTIGGASTSTTAPLPTASTIDGVNDVLPIYTASATATQGINRNVLLGLTSGPLGLTDSQSVSNKTIGNSNSITVKDGSLTLQNTSDATKQAVFSLAGITTGTTRTYSLPNATDTLAGLTATQTLTNKTLTSPTISGATLTNAIISADTITGFTTSTNGTIYGMSITGGVLASAALANAVNTAAIQNNAVTSTQIATNGVSAANLATTAITIGYAQITSNFTSTATPTVTDITGLSVTVTVPSGSRYISIMAFLPSVTKSGTAGDGTSLYIREGSTTLNTTSMAIPFSNGSFPIGCQYVNNSVTAGSHTYKLSFSQGTAGTFTTVASSTVLPFIWVQVQ